MVIYMHYLIVIIAIILYLFFIFLTSNAFLFGQMYAWV